MTKVVLVCGTLAGLLLAGSMLISLSIASNPADYENGWIVGLVTMLLALSTIVLGVRHLRDRVYGGTVTFGQALKAGLLITLVASVLYVVAWEVLFNTAFQDFPEQHYQYQVSQAMESDLKGAERDEYLAMLQRQRDRYTDDTLYRMFITSTEILPMGILVSLITALVFKRKKS